MVSEQQTEIAFEAGIFCWSGIRDSVREAKFRGAYVDLFESSGWLFRRFVIRGEPAAVRTIERALQRWAKELEREAGR